MTPHIPVVGIDPSLTGTGIATPTGVSVVTSQPGNGTVLDRRNRLTRMADTIAFTVLESVVPRMALVVIEAPAYSKTGHQHERSGLWWLLIDRLIDAGHMVCEVAPSARARYATGKGNAGKDQVIAAVVRRYPGVDVNSNDEADALVLRAMGCRYLGQPIDNDLPLANRAALDKVTWPAALASQVAA